METIEQVNEDFNLKKPKKKGLIIGGIVSAVAFIVAFLLVYFFVLTNPKFIFSKSIDKILKIDSQKYDSIKIDTKIKADIELEDATYKEQLPEIEKCEIQAGVQMDVENKQEIVDLGLEYDNQEVIDAQIYYDDGEMYAYLEGLFDKYIQIDMDEETRTEMDKLFEAVTSEEKTKNAEKALTIIKDEFKAQVKEKGEFEKEKTTIDVADDEQKVTKTTVTLTEKQLWEVTEDMLKNLADSEEFLECFKEDTIEYELKKLSELVKENKTNGKSNVKISIYTKGLLNNKLIALDMQVYVESEATTIVISTVKEDEGVYSYSVSGKVTGAKIDLLQGKIENEKDKDSKKEKTGKLVITAEIFQLGSAKLEIDYLAEFNQGIDKINTSNSVNMNDLTETELEAIATKLMERPLIGEVIKSLSTVQNENNVMNQAQIPTIETNITTSENEVKDEEYGYSVTYSIPNGFAYDSQYSGDHMKFYNLAGANYSYINATVSLDWYTETEYIEDEIKWNYNYYLEGTEYYKNVNLSEIKTLDVGDKNLKYALISYETTYNTTEQKAYVWYCLDSEHMFTVEIEATDTEITEDIIRGFLNINVTELN